MVDGYPPSGDGGDKVGGIVDWWMCINLGALDGCLQCVPIHERLWLPRHVGEHLEGRYGVDSGGGGWKKTLAKLREESRCIVVNVVRATEVDDNCHRASLRDGVEDSSRTEEGGGGQMMMMTMEEKEGGNLMGRTGQSDNEDDAEQGNNEEREDLEAWLDDMIA
jgi:hypothetical protein